MSDDIQKLEMEVYELNQKLFKMRRLSPLEPVKNYNLRDLNGEVSLLELFGERDTLFAIHNMGQGCRYCTLWADGFNGLVPHLEDKAALVLMSKDAPELQRRFANSRGWKFRMVSHGGGDYMKDQCGRDGKNNPGLTCYVRKGDQIFRKNVTSFGPGDSFSPQWHFLSLVGDDWDSWTPQFSYWQRPAKMDDGGQNLT